MSLTLHVWVPGDFLRASWLNLPNAALEDHEDRIVALEGAGVTGVPSRFVYYLGGLELAAITATAYARIPGSVPIWLASGEMAGYDLTLSVSRYTEDAGTTIRVALCQLGNMANVLAETPTTTSTTVADDATTTVTAPAVGIWAVLAAKMASSSAAGHVVGGHIQAVAP